MVYRISGRAGVLQPNRKPAEAGTGRRQTVATVMPAWLGLGLLSVGLLGPGELARAEDTTAAVTDSAASKSVTSDAAVDLDAITSPFFDQVKTHFAAWDLDHDGELTANEIELAVHNPAYKGDAAAAATALRRAARGDKSLAPLSLTKIATGLTTKSTSAAPQPKYESLFKTAKTKIDTLKTELFPDGPPKVQSISQGRLGNCFLLASLGTVAHCEPERLVGMMTPQDDGKVLISLGCGRTMVLDAPTDAERAIGATTKNTGTWANMYEKAIGTVMLERSKTGRHVTPLSLIGVGGTPSTPLSILTGHKVRRHGCELYRDVKDEAGASAADLTPLREDLKAAFAEGRFVVGGCGPKGKQALVKGIYYNHSYGVLEYDEATDTVLFWNPFGNKYTPKGPDGLEHGYTTSYGQFRVPLKEAVMWFGSFSIETDESVE